MTQLKETQFKNFSDFWPFYLAAHSHNTNRALHFTGTILGYLILFYSLASAQWHFISLAPFVGYLFSWTGHFVFEKNTPATFKYPMWSFMGDMKMVYLIFLKGIRFQELPQKTK